MAKKNEENKEPEIYQDPDLLREKISGSSDFFRKYNKIILGIIIAIVVVVGGYFFYKYQKKQQNETAQAEMYHAFYHFEQDSLERALHGDVTSKGLLDIIDDYPGTKAANISHFYVGIIFMKQEEFDKAIEHLKEFSSDDLVYQGRAYSLIGDAYLEKENYEKAEEYYKQAAEYKPNKFYTPAYLMKLALAHELQAEYEQAVGVYDKIIEAYPSFQGINEAKKFRAKALAKVRD